MRIYTAAAEFRPFGREIGPIIIYLKPSTW